MNLWFKKEIVIVVIAASLMPSLAYAAWWKPWTWFKKAPATPQIEISTKIEESSKPTGIASTSAAKEKIKVEKKAENELSEIEKLKKEIEELKKKQSVTNIKTEPIPIIVKEDAKPKIVNLPNGAVVEMDERGNILRYIKEVAQPTYTAPVVSQNQSVQISSIKTEPAITSVKISWQTDKPTESKIFISGGEFSSKLFPSESGLSTKHSVFIENLKPNTTHTFEIEAISTGTFAKQTGSFSTNPLPQSIIQEDFESYSNGTLQGQNGWQIYTQGTGTGFTVVNGEGVDGTKAAYTQFKTGQIIAKKGWGLLSDGKQNFYIKTADRASWGFYSDPSFQIRISKNPWGSGAGSPFIAVGFRNDGNVAYYDPITDSYKNFGTFADRDWTLLEVEWRLSDKTARYRLDNDSINNGKWTDWYTFKNATNFSGFDTVSFGLFRESSEVGGVYFDNLK